MSKRLPLAAVCLLAAAVPAQVSPFRSPLLDAGDFAFNVTSGDVDADGDNDLVINNGGFVWLVPQVAPGVFGAPTSHQVFGFIDRMALADFDLDGDLDLGASVDQGSPFSQDYLAVFEGLGAALGPPVLLESGVDPSDIVAGDFDEDGAVDLAQPCSAKTLGDSGKRVAFFRGFGDGSFAPMVEVLAGNGPRFAAAGDVNLDGHLDLTVLNGGGTLRTLLGDGDLGFVVGPGTEMSNAARDVALGDVDGNGVPDALVGFEWLHVRLALGAGDGTWLAQPFVPLPNYAPRAHLADVDEDGDDDVVALQTSLVPNPSRSGFAVVLNEGDGSFAAPTTYSSVEEPEDLAVADFTEDGDLDVFLTVPQFYDPASGQLLRGDGAGHFDGTLLTGDRPTEAALADLDLDGVPELLVACAWGPELAVHPGLGHGGFGAAQMHEFGVNLEGVVGADIVEDGLPDVLVINSGTPGGITVRAGDGALGFGPPITSTPGDPPWGLDSGDADLDGHLDILLACYHGTARVLLGDGAGHFTFSDDVPTASSSPEAAAFGDLDDDGLLDLVATSNGPLLLTVALGQGGGQFTGPTQVPVTYYNQHDVVLGDLDGDEDLDIVTSGGAANGVNILRNDGNADFSAGPALSAAGTWGVAIADVDGDGHADVLAGAGTNPATDDFGAVVTWLADEHDTFAAPSFALAPADVHELLVADLDGDGRPDAVALAAEHDQLWLLPNLEGPWDPLGQGLAGTQGEPRQQGFGSLQPGEPFEFLLTDGLPGGTTWHVVGLAPLGAPFKGGTMVPVPLLINGPLPLDGQGDLVLAGTWPGPSVPGLEVFLQFWTPDPAGVKDWSASNGLQGTLP